LDSHEDLIKVEGIAVPLMPTPKSLRVPGAEFDTPQSDRLVTDRDTAFSHQILDIAAAQIEAMIEPNNVLNDLGRKAVALIHRCRSFHPPIVARTSLSCQYPNYRFLAQTDGIDTAAIFLQYNIERPLSPKAVIQTSRKSGT